MIKIKKHNNHKRIMAWMICVALLISMFATTVNAETVVTNTPTVGSLKLTKTDDVDDDGYKKLSGAKFTAYKIMDLTPGENPGDFAEFSILAPYNSVLNAGNAITPDELGNYSASAIEELVSQLLPLTKTDLSGIESPATDSNGETTISNMSLGYYLIVETTTPTNYVAGNPFFVSIPSTDNYANSAVAGTAWVYDIEATPKNTTVPFDKGILGTDWEEGYNTTHSPAMVDEDFTGLGGTVTYAIKTTIPDYSSEYFVGAGYPIFEITDKLEHQALQTNTIAVSCLDDKHDSGYSLVLGTDYTLDAVQTATQDFIITLSKSFLEDHKGHAIQIVYDAILGLDRNGDIDSGLEYEIGNDNTATLKYGNDPTDLTKFATLDDDTKVFTFKLEIEKYFVNESNKTALADAKFQLFADATCLNAIDDGANFSFTAKTNGSGKISFPAVAPGTYYIKELESPLGYQLLVNPIKVQITPTLQDGEFTGQHTFTVDGEEYGIDDTIFTTRISTSGEDTSSVIAVENHKGFTPPITGAMGIGLIVLAAMAILFVMNRRTNKKLETENIA